MEKTPRRPLRMPAERLAQLRQVKQLIKMAAKQTNTQAAKAVAKVTELLGQLRTKK